LVSQLQGGTRIALSGTPVMNNTFDLYAQLEFLLPGIFGSRGYFKREYADPIDRDQDPEKIAGLQKLTAPFILRRTKEQVAPDLPAKTEMIMWCEMGVAQKECYENIREQISSSLFLNIKQEGVQKNKLALLQGILKLRQACNSPLLLAADEQTQSGPRRLAREEGLEDVLHLPGRHADTVVGDFEQRFLAIEARRTDQDVARSAVRHPDGFDRVGEEVHQHPLQLDAVGLDRWQRFVEREHQRHIFGGQFPVEQQGGLANQIVESE
ncbi:MAG: hypothetical protein EOP21_03090, partial [Hyphomicrobiales bacterium]